MLEQPEDKQLQYFHFERQDCDQPVVLEQRNEVRPEVVARSGCW